VRISFYTDKAVDGLTKVNVESLPYTFLSSYKNFAKNNYGSEIIIALEEKEGIFIALSRHKSKFIVNAQLLSEPFTMNGVLDPVGQKSFYEELIRAMKEQNIADRIITPQNFVVLGAVPGNSYSCNFGSYVVNLLPSKEDLYAAVNPKHRNKISKAERAGVQVKTGREQLPVFYSLYNETMKRSNMYCEPFSFFESLYTNLGEGNCICSVVYHNDQPQGGLLAPFTRYCCYYVYGASSAVITESGSINFLHWKTMLLMKEAGVRAYDFVGARLSDVSNTKLEGIQSFKERFGGTLKRGYLFKADINSTKCSLFDSLLAVSNKVKGRKKFKDIIDQEIEKQSA
jgi:hypothetical protein